MKGRNNRTQGDVALCLWWRGAGEISVYKKKSNLPCAVSDSSIRSYDNFTVF